MSPVDEGYHPVTVVEFLQLISMTWFLCDTSGQQPELP